jgi:NTE family protein
MFARRKTISRRRTSLPFVVMEKNPIALIITGAVAKGPFHAGALSVLADRRLPVASVVGTSAGALNAAVFAAGVAVGRVKHAARIAEEVWLEHASWSDIVSPSLSELLHGQVPFDAKRIRHLLSEGVARVLETTVSPDQTPQPSVRLTLVATDLLGHLKSEEGPNEPTQTTFERSFAFSGADFMTTIGRERILDAATASATFPLLFAPWKVDGRPYIDGGAVNNAPVSYAIEPFSTRRLVVISGQPAEMDPPASLGAVALLPHVVEILINERLFRDLRGARKANRKLAAIEEAMSHPDVPEEVRVKVRGALDWQPLEIVEIRPLSALEGNAFAGFGSAELRKAYFAEGKSRAAAILR